MTERPIIRSGSVRGVSSSGSYANAGYSRGTSRKSESKAGSMTQRVYELISMSEYTQAACEISRIRQAVDGPEIPELLLFCHYKMKDWDKCLAMLDERLRVFSPRERAEWLTQVLIASGQMADASRICKAEGLCAVHVAALILNDELDEAKARVESIDLDEDGHRALLDSVIAYYDGDVRAAFNLDPRVAEYNRLLFKYTSCELDSLKEDLSEYAIRHRLKSWSTGLDVDDDPLSPAASFNEVRTLKSVVEGAFEQTTDSTSEFDIFNNRLCSDTPVDAPSIISFLEDVAEAESGHSSIRETAASNLLIEYCRETEYDKAADLLVSNDVESCFTNPDDYTTLRLLIHSNTDVHRMYAVQELTGLVDAALQGGRVADARRVHALVAILGKHFYDIGNITELEALVAKSSELCGNDPDWILNAASGNYVAGKFEQAALEYGKVVESAIDQRGLLSLQPVVLACYCASLVMISENERAEEIMAKVQEREADGGQQSTLHSTVINVVLGHLYCSKGNFEFGIERVMAALEDEESLSVETWHYCKVTLMSLINALAEGTGPLLSDAFIDALVAFLDRIQTSCTHHLVSVAGEAKYIHNLLLKVINH